MIQVNKAVQWAWENRAAFVDPLEYADFADFVGCVVSRLLQKAPDQCPRKLTDAMLVDVIKELQDEVKPQSSASATSAPVLAAAQGSDSKPLML